jgi:alkylhydroperoxidase family enzyme
MSYIEQVAESEATGIVASIYKAARDRVGSVSNVIKVMSTDAKSMQGSMQFYVSLMKTPNAVSPSRREMLATVVSNANDCYY